jgi:hypothetical protein
MRAKLTIFILSAFLLWTSLPAVSHHSSLSKFQEVQTSDEFVKAIVSGQDVIWKKSPCHFHNVFIDFAKAKVKGSLERLRTTSPFTQKSVKYYLLFRALRN